MSTQPMPASTEISGFSQTWGDCLIKVVSQVAGTPVTCRIVATRPGNPPIPAANDFWLAAVCSGGLRGEMSLRIPVSTSLQLARTFMQEPTGPVVTVSDSPLSDDHREAVLELMRQVSGLVATSVSERWGAVQLRLEQAGSAPSWAASAEFWAQIEGIGSAPVVLLEFILSPALCASLRSESHQPESSSPKKCSDPASSTENDLNFLMDVELAVTLRFGTQRLLLREVLDLTPGAVVELDRKVQDPVDLLLDGRLLARGEIVIVEGNYGLRVTEVGSTEA